MCKVNFKRNTTTYKGLLALLLVVLTFLLKAPLVDTGYTYSFEPDSEPCIEETRSFYFFFQNPSLENAPHTLTGYPNYSDGQFITSALLAHIVRPLCKAGIIKTNLSDADNSLIIFSMRWAGVCFNALAAVFVFFSIILLTGNTAIAFVICLLYYLLNLQTLPINLIRTDHYTLFTAAFATWAALRLYILRFKSSSYIFMGIAAGMVSATKINFPFYLVLPSVIVLMLLAQKNISIKHFAMLLVAFVLAACFMYCRWLLYPENILSVIKTTFGIGEDWVNFWGNGNVTYYLYGQFVANGSSTGVTVLLLLFYGSFLWCLISGLLQRSQIKVMLCIAFVIQMLALSVSPKVGRYGILVPVYLSLFMGFLFADLYKLSSLKTVPLVACILLLLPVFGTSYQNYNSEILLCRQTQQSIAETRLPAAQWIEKNYAPGSLLAVQHPRVSNPPVFNLPYRFNYSYLQFPFLYHDKLCHFLPPDIATLKANTNGIVINDKECNYHLLTLQQQGCSPAVYEKWQAFYHSLHKYFPEKKFESVYPNYGVKSFAVYTVNDTPRYHPISPINVSVTHQNNRAILEWKYTYHIGENAYRFEIQIAEDSAMQWLVYGSRDGYISKYRTENNPEQVQNLSSIFLPPAVKDAYHQGKFNHIIGSYGPKEMDAEFENFFAAIVMNMKNNNLTFGESMKQLMHGEEDEFISVIKALYKGKANVFNMHLKEYLQATELNINENIITDSVNIPATWHFTLPIKLRNNHKYYFRVRFKGQDKVMSDWSPTVSVVPSTIFSP